MVLRETSINISPEHGSPKNNKLSSLVNRRLSEDTIFKNCCQNVVVCVLSHVTPWTVTLLASLSMAFSRQEYWSGLPFPSPGDLPDPGNEPGSPALQADSSPSEPLSIK